MSQTAHLVFVLVLKISTERKKSSSTCLLCVQNVPLFTLRAVCDALVILGKIYMFPLRSSPLIDLVGKILLNLQWAEVQIPQSFHLSLLVRSTTVEADQTTINTTDATVKGSIVTRGPHEDISS